MDLKTRELLGYRRALELVQAFAQCPMGRDEIGAMTPTADLATLRQRLALIEECGRFIDQGGKAGVGRVEDPRPLAQRLRDQDVLEPGELLALTQSLKAGCEIRQALSKPQWPLLSQFAQPFPDCGQLTSEIERAIDPSGEIRDSAHPQLGKARRQQVRMRDDAQSHLGKFFSGAQKESLIAEPFVTSRGNRFVIPVRVERQKEIPGIVHGASSSGATVFLEPLSAVELNNQYLYHQERERELIRQVLARLSAEAREQLPAVEELIDGIGRADALFAVCRYARRYRCVTPDFDDQNRLELRDARHPLLIESLGFERVVPTSLHLTERRSGIVISGPNTGGKTVALKTLGLLSLLAQSGIPVPASRAALPVFRDVLADIGDHQSISEQLSTFSAHVLRIRAMLDSLEEAERSQESEQAGLPTLILLDELGTGTDPVHGAALGVAIVEFLLQRRTFLAATTHHQALKVLASTNPGLINASVELDDRTHAPTYHLRLGLSGASSGLEIARQLGLSEQLVERARGLLSETDRQAESYLEHLRRESESLRRSRLKLEQRRQALRKEESRLREEHQQVEEKQAKQFEKALGEWSKDFKRLSERYLNSFKDRFEAVRVRQEVKRRQSALQEAFRQRFKDEHRRAPGEAATGGAQAVEPGAWVEHAAFKKRGKVVSTKPGEVIVDFQGKRMNCRPDQVSPVSPPQKEPRRLPRNVSLNAVEEADPELNLVGSSVEDALQRADKFLDRAFLGALREVRLIHGHGKGKLRRALSELLEGHPHVSSYKGEGGSTRVMLRE